MTDNLKEIRRKHEGFVYEGYEDDVHGAIGFLISEIDRLQEERDKLIEGLKFYAHEDNWRSGFVLGLAQADGGERAQAILDEIGVNAE